jgi:hypothetical protein
MNNKIDIDEDVNNNISQTFSSKEYVLCAPFSFLKIFLAATINLLWILEGISWRLHALFQSPGYALEFGIIQ